MLSYLDKKDFKKEVKMKKTTALLMSLFLMFSLSACGKVEEQTTYNKHEGLKEITMLDVISKSKEKAPLIQKINPAEEYVIDTYFTAMSVADRKKHQNDSLQSIVQNYQNVNNENIPEGNMQAKDLKWKYLAMDHAAILMAQSYSQADIGIMKRYTATFLGSPEMNKMREETIGTLIEKAKKKYPEEYKSLVEKESLMKKKMEADAQKKADEQLNKNKNFQIPMRIN